jgi:CBS domain containing-hemolysin-like protein
MSRDSPLATSQEVMTDVLRCRPDDLIADLLERMQTQGTWMAIVTDEDGHTVGLATIEDLVAELVGEIADEQWTPPRP